MEQVLKVYYAHHMWKYGTKIEAWELELIQKRFPDAQIINPATDIDQTGGEGEVMERCLAAVRNDADAVVFSHLSGVIGKGVLRELEEAASVHLPVYMIHGNRVERAPQCMWFERLEGTGHRSIYAQLHIGPRGMSMEDEERLHNGG